MSKKIIYNKIRHTPMGVFGVITIWLFLCTTAGWVTDCADIENYRNYYENESTTEFYINTLTNPGFYYIYTIFQSLGFSFEHFHATFYVFVMSFLVWFVWKYSRRPVVILLLYISVAFFADVIQMKNTLAMVLLYIALIGIVDESKNYSKSIIFLFIALAATIHVGFLAYLVLLLYDKKIYSSIFILLMMAMSLLGHSILRFFMHHMSFLGSETIAGKAESYLTNGSAYSLVICSFIFLVNFFTCKRFFHWQINSSININRLITINVLLASLITFTSVNMTMFRLFRNIVLFNSIFLINGYEMSNKTINDKVILSLYFFIMSLYFFLSSNVLNNVVAIFQSNSLF